MANYPDLHIYVSLIYRFTVYSSLEHDRGEDLVDNEVEAPQRRISTVREAVAGLEYTRQRELLDKGVIGRISNKKRDLAGELAVIPKRVPFKWQRGNKIGKAWEKLCSN